MSRARRVCISANHKVEVANSKQDCRNRARRIDREVQRPIVVPVVAVKDSCAVYIVPYRQPSGIIEFVSKGRGSCRDAKGRYGSVTVDETLEDSAAVRIKSAGKVPEFVYPKQIGLDRARNIVFCEGRAPQEKRVKGAIAGCVVTDYFTEVINAPSFGKTHGIVRVDDRLAKATIDEPGKTARYSAESMNSPTMSPISLIFCGKVEFPVPG